MLEQKIAKLKEILPIEKSYDVIGREITVSNKKAYYVFVDGFAKDEVLYYFLENIQNCTKGIYSLEDFLQSKVAYIEAEIVKNDPEYNQLKTQVLCGMFALVFEDFDEYLLLDTREYPVRGMVESEVEKVIRGPKDSFVETILFNTSLVRRRVRSEKLIFEMEKIGNFSKTDIAISYIDGLCNKTVLENIKKKIKSIDTNTVIVSAQYLEELLFDKKWYNPLPLVKFTERPDVCAAYLSEGHIVLIVDTTPVALVLPVSIFHFVQHISDYNIKFINGTIAKIVRITSVLLSIFLAPIFIYLADNTQIFSEIAKKGDVPDKVYLSYFGQIGALEVAFLMLQVSSLHIPSQIAPLIGIIGGLLLSDIAIKIGLFTPIALLTMTAIVITTYSIPSYEFTDALRLFRLFMIICTGIFGLYGLIGSLICVLVITITTQTIEGAKRYTYPLIPFDFSDLKSLLIRENIKDME